MRTTLLIIAVAAFFLSSCSTGSKMQSTSQGDDLYVAETDPYVQPQYAPSSTDGSTEESYEPTDPSASDKYSDQDGTNGNYYGNDYGYTSSLNHWYGPSLGFSYYSPFYSGFSYYNPYYYSPGLSFSFGFGWGSPWPSYYYPWYSPYYSYYPWYYSPYYSPYYGNYWNDGYYGGGYNNYYYSNSYYGYNGSSSNNTSNDPNGGRPLKLGDDNISSDAGNIASSTATAHQIPVSPEISNGKGNLNPGVPIVKGDDGVESIGNIHTEKAVIKGNSPSITPGIKINTLNSPADSKSVGAPSKNSMSPRQNTQNKPPRTIAFVPREQQQGLNHAPATTKNSATEMVRQQQYKVIGQDENREESKQVKSSAKGFAPPQHSKKESDSRNDKQPQGKQFNNDNRSSMNSGNYSRNDNSGGNSRPSNDNRNSDRSPRKQ